jgi:mannose-6-phosphate isomerase-like protein (cupin superfamily)|tara:strand:+ start:1113 stop:2219 length:1107 start_codon:yes stop_codon:yes gene_type:complete
VKDSNNIQTAEVVLACSDLDETLAFFVETLQFQIDRIFPADAPTVAVLSGYGIRLRLDRHATSKPATLRLYCSAPTALAQGNLRLQAPNGTEIELEAAENVLQLPPVVQSLVVSRLDSSTAWGVGRAGMRYRDLIPDRQGGRFIASHIHIPDAGPVPDYVHYHRIRFQLIFCCRGWAKLVYEDQGGEFILSAGDCVLQPPQIRHRVLECSDNMEVVEIGCPAEHETIADHEMDLPTAVVNRKRLFMGQRFVRHQAETASWAKWRIDGFECRDSGIGAATSGLAGVRVVRPQLKPTAGPCSHVAEFVFFFVLKGSVTLELTGRGIEQFNRGDSMVLPSNFSYTLVESTQDLELLEVTLPDIVETHSPGA